MRAVEDASVLWNSQNSSTAQGKLEETAPMYKRSRIILEKVLGPDHPNVAASLNSSALTLSAIATFG